jgi:hypothetical protein
MLVEHYVSPFLHQRAIEIVVKGLNILEIKSLENMSNRLFIFIAKVDFDQLNNFLILK